MTYVPGATYTPYVQHDRCDVHPGVKWSGDVPCFVCHPTEEQEGTVEHLASIVPDPSERFQPVTRSCMVLCDPRHDHICGRPMSTPGHTVLGFPMCDECHQAVAL